MNINSVYEVAEALVDWVPDTLWDSVAIMLGLYALVLVGVIEAHLWFDRRTRTTVE